MAVDTAPISQGRFEAILAALGVGATAMAGVWAWRGNEEAMGMGLVLAVLAAGLWSLSRMGYSRLASVLIVLALNAITLLGVSYFGGPRGHAPAFLMVVVMCSGLMVGWKGGAASLAVCAACLLVDGWYGPAPWATGTIADKLPQVTTDWLLALLLSGSLAVVAFHTASQRIQEAVRSEDEKREALQHARAASQAKSAFLANMSHELRTPLTAILGYAELLEEDLDGHRAKDVARIEKAGRHLLALIDDVLDMARVEAGRLELEEVTVDLDQLLPELTTLVAPWADRSGARIRTEYGALGTVVGDPLRIRQILQNLLSNAIKYAPGPIDLAATRFDDRVEITVRDHGSGIPKQVLPTLFEPFSRGHGSDKEGTGLGLALSEQLAARMGGRLTVDSSDLGAAFTLSLPLAGSSNRLRLTMADDDDEPTLASTAETDRVS